MLKFYVMPMALVLGISISCSVESASEKGSDSEKIHAGSTAFDVPTFTDYEALYSSGSSTTGAFTLQVRNTNEGKSISLIDIIPSKDFVIVGQRQIDRQGQQLDYTVGPFFAWGEELVVGQMADGHYDWTRIPIGGGDPIRSAGKLENGGFVSDLFSPTLAGLMPRPVGSKFQLPVSVPRQDQTVSSWWEEYTVLRKESLDTPSGRSCDCWVIEKAAPGGGITHIWVAREAPFVFKRHRDVGGKRSLISELLSFRILER